MFKNQIGLDSCSTISKAKKTVSASGWQIWPNRAKKYPKFEIMSKIFVLANFTLAIIW